MAKQLALSPLFGTHLQGEPGQSLLDLSLDEVRTAYRQYGAIWFSGFQHSIEDFKSFTSSLSSGFAQYVGGAMSRSPIGGDQTVVSVTNAGDTFGVPLHGELWYRARPPRLLWFYCDIPAETGGETTVCDAFLIYNQLSEHARAFLEQHQLVYIRSYSVEDWQQIYQTENIADVREVCADRDIELDEHTDGSITTRYRISPLTTDAAGRRGFINNILPVVGLELAGKTTSIVRTETGYGLPHEVLVEIRMVCEKLTFPVPMKSGDLLMVDNTRVMHGRRAFTGKRAVYSRIGDPDFEV